MMFETERAINRADDIGEAAGRDAPPCDDAPSPVAAGLISRHLRLDADIGRRVARLALHPMRMPGIRRIASYPAAPFSVTSLPDSAPALRGAGGRRGSFRTPAHGADRADPKCGVGKNE